MDGVLKALKRIAEATQPAQNGNPKLAHAPRLTFRTMRNRLSAVGLDLTLTAK